MIYEPLKEFNQLFMMKISLPVANEFNNFQLCDATKAVTYENCNGK